jgi:hypothetical protein
VSVATVIVPRQGGEVQVINVGEGYCELTVRDGEDETFVVVALDQRDRDRLIAALSAPMVR